MLEPPPDYMMFPAVQEEIRGALLEEIRCGNCVAFVGAGFSAAASLPSWRALLGCLAQGDGVEPALRAHVVALAGDPGATAHALDQAAQMVADLRTPEGAGKIVFTREDYRRRLYGDPAYVTFLRSIFSTATVLYLGFSFTDAYLNELRSEILALLGYTGQDKPIAYAVVNDVSVATQKHFLRHEGIHILPYDSNSPPDFYGFDEYLDAIHRATGASSQLGVLLSGRRILWMDPNRDGNEYGVLFLERSAKTHGLTLDPITMTDTPGEALTALADAERSGHPFDLVISYWGRVSPPATRTPGMELLMGMRARDFRCPVLIFAGKHDADRRKREALSLGAQAYCYEFETLFRRIEEIFSPAKATW